MRYGLLLIALLCLSRAAFTQDNRTVASLRQDADNYFENEQFNLAIQYYRELADMNVTDVEVNYRLAECYMKMFNYPEAEAYFLKVHYLAPKAYPLALYYYALMLKYNGSFEESILYFDEFISVSNDNASLKEFVEQAEIDRSGSETALAELGSTDKTLRRIPLNNLNTKYNDYAPAVRDSTTIVITSGRIASNRQSIDERFGEAFTDNFYFEKTGGNWEDRTKSLFSVTNSRYNDGSGSFNSDGTKYYYTVCGEDGPQCRIYMTSYKGGKWTTPVALNPNINFRSFEAKHPAVSHGGDTLVFSSNRSGGHGKFDLWMSIDAGEDNWGPPVNLGKGINSKLNELSPTFTAFPNILFFSSEGHQGYGGLDVYMAKRLSTGEMVVYNLDAPFNSARDDCFMSFADHELYWSSNRSGGQGGFDVMAVKIPSVIAFISRISLKKRNANRDISLKSKSDNSQKLNIQASRLEERIDYDKLTYEKKQIVEQMMLDRARGRVTESSQFNLTVEEFQTLKKIANTRYEEVHLRKKGILSRIKTASKGREDLTVTGMLADSVSNEKVVDRRIMLTDSLGEVLKITRSNESGKFKFTDVPSAQTFYLRLDNPVSEAIKTKVVLKDLSIVTTKERQVAHVENIYFDYDHYRIRSEGSKVLDELAKYLIANPGVQLEVFAFADDRGTTQYNMELTRKRGQSVIDYLARQGVDQTSMAVIAKGKQSQKEVDVELQRQFDRRVEFYLNGNSAPIAEIGRTYILKKKMSRERMSSDTGVTREQLAELNGELPEELKAFQPVRLPSHLAIPSDLFFTVP